MSTKPGLPVIEGQAVCMRNLPGRLKGFVRGTESFTLIELLVVTLILGVVVATITSCLIGGIRTWEYVSKYGTVEVDTLVKLETIQREVASTFLFYRIPVSGGPREISFPCLIEEISDKDSAEKIGTVKYYYDEQKKELFRKSWAFPEAESLNDQPEKIITGLRDFTITYYSLPSTNNSDGGVWQDTWLNVTNLPGAVTMELLFEGDNNKPVVIKRTIMIPAAAASEIVQDENKRSKVPGR